MMKQKAEDYDYDFEIPLHPSQEMVWRNRRRFNVACCGRRWGKTVLSQVVLFDTLATGLPAAYFAPTYKMLEKVWREFKRDFAEIIAEKDEKLKWLKLVNGAQLDFWSLDAYESIRGQKYRAAVIDEAAISPYLEDAWQMVIRPTLTDHRGHAWFFSTPKGRNFFHKLAEKAKRNENWTFWQLPTSDNPHIDPAEIEEAKNDLPSTVYQQEYLAQFIDVQGALVKREMLTYVNSNELPSDLRIGMGVDLAISQKETADYSSIVIVGYHKDSGRRYVLDVWRGRVGFHDVVSTIQSYSAKWKPSRINVEAVQYQVAVVQELLRKTSLPVRAIKPDRDKVSRFHGVLARYEQMLFTHVRGIDPAFEHELLSFPTSDHDDMVDALVYADQAAVKSMGAGAVII